MADVQIAVSNQDNTQIAVIDQQNTQIALAAPSETQVSIAVPGIQGATGQVGDVAVAQDGTAGTPGIRFENDTNTGIYRLGADQLAISTNGTGRLFVDASGNVATGTNIFAKALTINNTNAAIALRANSAGTYTSQGIFFNVDGADYAQIYNDGPGNLVFRSGAGLPERARIDTSGRLLVGSTSSIPGAAPGFSPFNLYNPGVQFSGTSYQSPAWLALSQFSASTTASGGAFVSLRNSNNTIVGSHSILISGQRIGAISFDGSDGAKFVDAALIAAEVDGNPGTDDMPGRLVFSTTADGASSLTERMRIKSTGIVNIVNTPTYADNTAAKAGGLVDGDVYRTATGQLMIVYT